MRRNRILIGWLLTLLVASGVWAGDKKTDEAPPESPVKVHLKRTEPRTIATMLHKGSLEQIPEVAGRLLTAVREGGHLAAGPLMIVYYNDPREVPQEECLWEAWMPVARPGIFGKADHDMMGFKYLGAMFVAYTYHIGPYETVGESYNMLFEWASRNTYKPVGPPVDVYWSDPARIPEAELVTEIWLPVEEKKIPGGVVE